MTPLSVHWRPRPAPLTAVAVVATGAAVAALAADTAWRLRPGGALSELRVTAGPGWLLVLGDADALPWADGVTYLGRDAGLLVPTTSAPDPDASFLAVALAPAPLRVVLPGHLLLSALPSRAPDPVMLADVR